MSGLSGGLRDLWLWLAGFSLVVACRFSLSSCGARAPGRVGSVVCGTRALSLRCASSVVVGLRLSCPGACGILVPRPGIEPSSPALEGGFFTTGPPGKSLNWFISISLFSSSSGSEMCSPGQRVQVICWVIHFFLMEVNNVKFIFLIILKFTMQWLLVHSQY